MRIEFLFFLHLLIASVVSGFGTIQQHRLRSLTVLDRLNQISLRSTPNDDDDDNNEASINVLGTRMECCCANVQNTGVGTGFYRNGYCSTGAQDVGRHTVCVRVSNEFLQFSKSVGNDLSTPFPEYAFPGLKDGDIWCICAQRWDQAYEFGKAPKLYLKATHEKTLDYVDFKVLRWYALDGSEADEEKRVLDEKRGQLERLFGQEAEESSE